MGAVVGTLTMQTKQRALSRDKVDDELEMTMVCHRPEGLEQLEAQTNFTRRELQALYRGFKSECPSGVVNEETFKQIYSQFFPHGDASTYAHYLFNAFDSTQTGSIKFEVNTVFPLVMSPVLSDFVTGLSVLLRGSVREKLEWTFKLYDINKDGYISREEMTNIVRAIYDMMGKYTYPALKVEAPRQHVESFFQKMDKNKDGVVSLEEFILSCQEADRGPAVNAPSLLPCNPEDPVVRHAHDQQGEVEGGKAIHQYIAGVPLKVTGLLVIILTKVLDNSIQGVPAHLDGEEGHHQGHGPDQHHRHGNPNRRDQQRVAQWSSDGEVAVHTDGKQVED
ncbi:hypothetical protein JZ751_006861 [Albula glossodonta]|uniref:EF-hand domain-containing protein n=1 Tax=Albula glossodonta TaxID=121402 RepID=A0A8T2P421_9TELE|nr:hypothetical protein JZ751_006861 [Albula glossodonta]